MRSLVDERDELRQHELPLPEREKADGATGVPRPTRKEELDRLRVYQAADDIELLGLSAFDPGVQQLHPSSHRVDVHPEPAPL